MRYRTLPTLRGQRTTGRCRLVRIVTRINALPRSGLITFAPLGGLQIDSSENHGQRCPVNLYSDGTVLADGDLETTTFQTLRPHDQAVSVPIKNLAAMLPAIEEDKVVAGHHVLAQGMGHDGVQPIELLSHIGGLGMNKDANGWRQAKHAAPPPGKVNRAHCPVRAGPFAMPPGSAGELG